MINQSKRRFRRGSVRRLRELLFGAGRAQRDRRASQPIHLESLEGRLMLASDLGWDPSVPTEVWASDAGAAQSSELFNTLVDSPAEGEDTPAQDLVAFAKALAQKTGVKLYAAAWCSDCNSQKALFEDGADFLPFIEVTNPDHSRNAVGIAANITSYPTWEFPDGTREVGPLSLATIAQRAGVAIPTGVAPTIAPIADTTLYSGSPLNVALNGYDPNGGTLTYSVVSSNPSLVQASVLTGNRSAKVTVRDWGDMLFQLFESEVPDATGRFVTLAESGFYNADSNTTPITVHRVANNFVFQFGDPTGTGTGGSSRGTFNDDFHPDLQHNTPGALSWAKSSDDTNNSQVFVTDVATRHLDYNHSYFGQLTEGNKVRDAINDTTGTAITGGIRPVPAVNIESVTIFNDVENGIVRLKAAEGASGETDITVTVTDQAGHQFVEVFHVNVTPDPYDGGPYLADIPAVRTALNKPATFVVSAIDVEGDPVFFDGVKSGSVNYAFSVNSSTGQVTVTPPTDYVGTMELLLRVKPVTASDTADMYDTQKVSISVVATAAPTGVDLVAASDSGYLNTDNITKTNSLMFVVSGVTSGAEVRLYRGTTLLGHATASINSTAVAITTSALASLGNGTYNVTATQVVDGLESSASAALSVTLDTTAPPVFTSTPPVTAAPGTLLSYNAQNAEEGATGAAYSLSNAPTGVVINASTGLVTWTPTAAQLGLHQFAIVISDAAGNTRSQDLSIQVTSGALNYIPSKLAGYAYIDANNNGLKETAETPLGGVVIMLSGTELTGAAVNQQKTTDVYGSYQFTNLAPGQYVLTQIQPKFLIDGIDSGGTLGTSTGADHLTINLPQDTDGQNLNFGERGRMAQYITVLDFLASTPRDTVLTTTTSDGVGQWYAVEGGWSHAKTLQFQLQPNRTSAKLDVTTAEQQYSTMLNFQLPQQVQHLGGAGVAQMVRIVATPAALFPGADCGACSAGEGEVSAITLRLSDDAEGEAVSPAKSLLVGASGTSGTWSVTDLNTVSSDMDAEGERTTTILMPPTPADGYLATDLLMAEVPSSVVGDLTVDQVLSDVHGDDGDFLDAVDAILAGLLE